MAMRWYDWHTVTERLQARLYALTKGRHYLLRLDTGFPTGYCDFINKRVVVNPVAFDNVISNEVKKNKDRDEANYLMSRAITGHEAAHVLYTDPEVMKAITDEDTKNIWNLLEDARIENICSQESHVAKSLFTLLSSTIMKTVPPFNDPDFNNPHSAVQVLMTWRLGFATPELNKEAREKWIQVRNLAEDALYAPTSWEVLTAAKRIVELLNLKQERQKQNDLRDKLQQVMDNSTSQMSNGSGSGTPMKNPLDNPNGDQQDQKSSGQNSNSGNNQGNDQGGDPGSDNSDGKDGKDSTGGKDDKGTSNDPNGADDKNSKGTPNDPGDTTGGSSGDRDGNPDTINIKELIEDVGNKVRESLDSALPQGDLNKMLKGASNSPAGAYRPDIIGAPYMQLYTEALPIAQELERELRVDNPKAYRSASQTPGRFKTRYYIRNDQTPFAKEKVQGKDIPKMALTLVLDRSVSMSGMMHDLRVMTMAIYLACEKLKIPLDIWVLEGEVHLKGFDEWGAHVMAKIAGIQAVGGTTMMPTLSSATAAMRKRPEGLKQIVMIHDGQPEDRAFVVDWKNSLHSIGLYCMYIVNGSYEGQTVDRKHKSMDDLVGPQNYCIAFVREVSKFWCGFMKIKRKAA